MRSGKSCKTSNNKWEEEGGWGESKSGGLYVMHCPAMVQKLVAEAHQSHHDTMLSQCHVGLRGRSAHAVEARGSALGCSPLCLKLICLSVSLFVYSISFFLSLVLKTQPNHWTKRMGNT